MDLSILSIENISLSGLAYLSQIPHGSTMPLKSLMHRLCLKVFFFEANQCIVYANTPNGAMRMRDFNVLRL